MLKWFAQSVTRAVITHQRSHREWKSLCLDQTLQTATTVWDAVLRFETEKSREKAFDGNFRNLSPSRRRTVAFTGFPLTSAVPITAVGTIATYWGREGDADLIEIILDHNNCLVRAEVPSILRTEFLIRWGTELKCGPRFATLVVSP
jgi:hypothetical protein